MGDGFKGLDLYRIFTEPQRVGYRMVSGFSNLTSSENLASKDDYSPVLRNTNNGVADRTILNFEDHRRDAASYCKMGLNY